MSERSLVIGTRGSALARWQAEHVAARLRSLQPGLDVRLEIIVTEGDRRTTGLLSDVGGKGLWVDEIEGALASRRVDLAVHSLKDVPSALRGGLILAAYPPRADPRDALVAGPGAGGAGSLDALPRGARVGTASLRRSCQIRARRPDLQIEILRGNVDTRLRKIAEGVVDAGILACAGLDRLGFADRITARIEPDVLLPAVGQGALAIETRADDLDVNALVSRLGDPHTEAAIQAERAMLESLSGGCKTPIAGYARVAGAERGPATGEVTLTALVGRPDGSQIVTEAQTAPVSEADALGRRVAARLLAKGAAAILAELNAAG